MNIITLGSFEIFHRGHLILLKKCRELADYHKVVVGLNTDQFIEKYKGNSPVIGYEERKAIILETGLVDGVIPNDQSGGNARDVIKESRADLIVIGSDWARKDYVGQLGIDWKWLDINNIGIVYLNYTHSISTTIIKQRLNGH
jgi:glycerol-3-phosphate cytidylyltransferase